jgi:hypothetical protein
MLSLPIVFTSAIGVFAPVFSRPVWQHVKVLMTGAVLAPGQRTVTASNYSAPLAVSEQTDRGKNLC